jgi:hypothetical protein
LIAPSTRIRWCNLGGRASPRAGKTCHAARGIFVARSSNTCGSANCGSRGRDPSLFYQLLRPNFRLLRIPRIKSSNPHPRSLQQSRIIAFLTLAQLGYAHWFFGNLYEAVVKVPDRLSKEKPPGSDDSQQMSLLGSGSPVRYFLPGVPVVMLAVLSAILAGWNRRRVRPGFVSLGLSTLLGFAVTGYLVRAVNFKLFFAAQPITQAQRQRLLRIWYRANIVRLLATGCAWLIASQCAARLSRATERDW